MTPDTIHALRVYLGLTQAELAVRLGVHAVTISRWETGAQAPSPMAQRVLRQLQRTAAKANKEDINAPARS